MQDEWSLLKKCLHGVNTFYFRIYIYFPLFADIRYGFKLETPKRALHCSVESEEEKFNWISLLEQAIRSAIDLQWCVIIRLRTPSVLEALPQSMNLYLEKLLTLALNYINKHCFTHIYFIHVVIEFSFYIFLPYFLFSSLYCLMNDHWNICIYIHLWYIGHNFFFFLFFYFCIWW